jgi:hypothetical protein
LSVEKPDRQPEKDYSKVSHTDLPFPFIGKANRKSDVNEWEEMSCIASRVTFVTKTPDASIALIS